jgi:hypothetical protein
VAAVLKSFLMSASIPINAHGTTVLHQLNVSGPKVTAPREVLGDLFFPNLSS